MKCLALELFAMLARSHDQKKEFLQTFLFSWLLNKLIYYDLGISRGYENNEVESASYTFA